MPAVEAYIGEIRLFGGNYAPEGWALCNGQILAIQDNPALFSLLSNSYGGNGTTTFGLPNLQGRAPVGSGTGVGLSTRYLGQAYGSDFTVLTVDQLPAHTHVLQAQPNTGDTAAPENALLANTTGLDREYSTDDSNLKEMNESAIGSTGLGKGFPVTQPSMVISYIICLQGIYPTRS
ncbi:tail fiber protein [Pontibacter sp. G13]|uniref:phage tail protein n=1 Tax=Pontibacter sp. G13 TaxID=3074898 RepID=UPI00288BBAA3|nr:tail fiber protein [Pontibacter sp. G13]WNJ19942.1 tail fiber protein [Pontibacter sp. G13]